MEITEEIRKTLDELKSAVSDVRELDGRVKAIESKGEKPDALLAEQVAKADKRLDELEAKYDRSLRDAEGAPEAKDGATERLVKFLRDGVNPDGKEVKALDVATSATAGNLTNPGYLREIQAGIVEFSPMRALVRTMSIGGPSVNVPKRSSTGGAAWVEETAARSDTGDPAFGLVNIAPFELYARVEVSRQLLEDAEFDIAAYLREDMTEQFGVAEGAAIVAGNGTGKPLGLIDATGGIDTVNAADQTTWILSADDLFDLFYNVKDGYARRGSWAMNRLTLPVIRKLQDAAGNYLWAPALAPGDPSTLLGRPYTEAVDFPAPTAGAYASGDRPIAFGDWRRAYMLVDRVGMTIERDPFTGADNGLVIFRARKRVGGKPMLTEAAKALQF